MLEREYPGVRFHHTDSHPPGLNAIIAGVLVGRYHSERDPAYGVLFAQPRSCGGRNQDQIMETDTQGFCPSAAPRQRPCGRPVTLCGGISSPTSPAAPSQAGQAHPH